MLGAGDCLLGVTGFSTNLEIAWVMSSINERIRYISSLLNTLRILPANISLQKLK